MQLSHEAMAVEGVPSVTPRHAATVAAANSAPVGFLFHCINEQRLGRAIYQR
jgi:hypothetical protein